MSTRTMLSAGLLLALALPPASAQVMPDPSLFGQPPDVARLSDSDASCEQLFAESEWLRTRIASMPKGPDPMEMSRQMQEDMRQAQKKMMSGQRARGIGSALLGLVPGAGMAAGALSSLGRSGPNTDALYDAMDKNMKAQQESMEAMGRLAQLHGRREHLTGLFLDRRCKVSGLDRNAVAHATARLDASDGEDAGTTAAMQATTPVGAAAQSAGPVANEGAVDPAPAAAAEPSPLPR